MGIKELYKLIKEFVANAIERITKETLVNEVVAIDANLASCKSLYSKAGTTTEDIINRLKAFDRDLRKNKTLPVWIFDNPNPPPETQDTRIERANSRHKYEEKSKEIAAAIKSTTIQLQDVWQTSKYAAASVQTTEQTNQAAVATAPSELPLSEQTTSVQTTEPAAPIVEASSELPASQTDLRSASASAEQTNPLVAAAKLQQELMSMMDIKTRCDTYSQHLDKATILRIYEALRAEQILCFISSRAADDLLAQLAKQKVVGYIISDDSDCLAQAVPYTLRGVREHFIFRYQQERSNNNSMNASSSLDSSETDDPRQFIYCYSYEKLLAGLELTPDQFIDLCILMGHDGDPKIDGIAQVKALEYIREYKTIERIIEAIEKNEIGALSKKTTVRKRRAVQTGAANIQTAGTNTQPPKVAGKKRKADEAIPAIVLDINPKRIYRSEHLVINSNDSMELDTPHAAAPARVVAPSTGSGVLSGLVTNSSEVTAEVQEQPTAIVKTNKFKCSDKFKSTFNTLRKILREAPCDNDLQEIKEIIALEQDTMMLVD